MKLSTLCARAGGSRSGTGPLVPPIVQTSTFAFESMAALQAYLDDPAQGCLYTRYENPTSRLAEQAVAALEGAAAAAMFSSGMAAITTTLLTLLKRGDRILSMRSIYGGAYRFMKSHLREAGVEVEFLETREVPRFAQRAGPRTRLLYLETPTNPRLDLVDLAALAGEARRLGLTTIVDSTFATPVGQRPLGFGCDLVIHSVSKYLSGHSDVIGGVVAGRAELIDSIRENRKIYGGSADPFAAWLLLRGLRTLAVRMEAHQRGALAVARALEEHPCIRSVYYPGLPSHPDHELARRQMANCGGMVTFELAGLERARAALDGLRLIERAASLGGVESVASIPVLTSHTGYSDEELARAGVSAGMIRLSVGIEDPGDLVGDLSAALGALS